MRSVMVVFLAILTSNVLLSGCGKKVEMSESERLKLAAKLDDWTLTRVQLDQIIKNMPESQRTKYDSPGGRAELTDRLIQDELYHREGLRQGIGRENEVEKQVQEFKRTLIITEYYKRFVEPLATPSEEELHDYYEANQDKFSILPVVRVQHVLSKDRQKLVDFKKRIEAGEPMTTIAHKYSEDEFTQRDGGDLGYFNPGGYIRAIGFCKEISDAAFSMEPGKVSDPIKWERGYSIIRVNEFRPASLRPFEELREEIKQALLKRRIDLVKRDVFTKLQDRYPVRNVLAEEFRLTQRTPEELWNLAQTSSDSFQRLRYYEEIVAKYPTSSFAPQALFMQGFVYAEEMKDFATADRIFNKVINEHPNSDVAKSAEWMLKNLDSPLPDFEDLEDLNKKISGKSK